MKILLIVVIALSALSLLSLLTKLLDLDAIPDSRYVGSRRFCDYNKFHWEI
jgi:hypothetical protein